MHRARQVQQLAVPRSGLLQQLAVLGVGIVIGRVREYRHTHTANTHACVSSCCAPSRVSESV